MARRDRVWLLVTLLMILSIVEVGRWSIAASLTLVVVSLAAQLFMRRAGLPSWERRRSR